jgi:hypothetical protein
MVVHSRTQNRLLLLVARHRRRFEYATPVTPRRLKRWAILPKGEEAMRSLGCMMAVAALAFAMPAQAGVNDPEVVIYRGAGVLDTGGGDNTGAGTAIHCTNFSGVNENIRFVIRNTNAALLANVALLVPHLNTGTVLTKAGFLYNGTNLNTGQIKQGTVAVAATSIHVTCTALQFEAGAAGAASPQTGKLHMTRFNPIAGTQE